MKRSTTLTIVIAIAMLALLSIGSGVQAGTTPKTTGSVGLSNPTQYISFSAFQSAPVKGSVSYTNFEVAAEGSGVWVPGDFSMGFAVAPDTTIAGTYAMTVTSFTPTSPTSVTFAGTGDCGCGWISTFTGTISGDSFSLSMTEINAGNPAETYAMTASGTISGTGSVAGVWSDNYGLGRTGTFAIADIGDEAFHYVAPVETASVTPPTATFSYHIPAGVLYAGTLVSVSVSDGGSPGAGNDTLGFNGGAYPIVSGNLTVFE
jgi:hypothetical protein